MTPVNHELFSSIGNGRLDYIYRNFFATSSIRKIIINGKPGMVTNAEMLKGMPWLLVRGSWNYSMVMNAFLINALQERTE